MRKFFLSIALASAVVVVNAQDMTSKRGVQILPESDEWAIGIDASPILRYFGNLFTQSSNNAPSFNFTDGQTIWFKKVRDEGFHYRGMLRIGFGGETTTEQSVMFQVTPPPIPTYVDDELKESEMNIALGAGFEIRRGKGRLQGYYGPELIIEFGSSSEEYTYGNAFSQDNTMPAFTNFGSNDLGGGNRVTERDFGSTFGLTLRGFVGLEYFFAPKLSVGGEFGWGLKFKSTGDAERTVEQLNDTGTAGVTRVEPEGSSSSFGIDTDNLGGAIRLVGYF
jgi:hypothetical protein